MKHKYSIYFTNSNGMFEIYKNENNKPIELSLSEAINLKTELNRKFSRVYDIIKL